MTYPLLYVLPAVTEFEVWTGFSADDHYGNTRSVILQQAEMARAGLSAASRKRAFDDQRKADWEKVNDPRSGDTWWNAQSLAERSGKRLLDPYRDQDVFDYFLRFDHDQLCRPGKPLIREALSPWLRGFDGFASGVRLQIGGGVNSLFTNVLNDPRINRFETRYSSVGPLCQRWGREVTANPGRYLDEVNGVSPRPKAQVRTSQFGVFRPCNMEDVRARSARSKFTVISAFAGGGGSSIGYRLAGGKICTVIEFVPEAARTYRTNFPEVHVEFRDIREVLRLGNSISAHLGFKRGQLDVLDGSPPCSEFSVAGRGIGDQSVMKSYSDVRQNNIASLPFDFIALASALLPKLVVMENVPALATRAPQLFQKIQNALRYPEGTDQAYFVHHVVLTATDFGVPQKRRRLFMIGIRRDVGEAVGINSDELVRTVFPSSTHFGARLREAFTGLEQPFSAVRPWIVSANASTLSEAIRKLPKNPPKHTRISDVDPDDESCFTLTRCSWRLPAPTLVVSGQQPNGITGAIHPEYDRKFSLPELKRLFALPDDYVFTGTLAQAAERVCRMVPPPMTKAIAEALYDRVLRPYGEVER